MIRNRKSMEETNISSKHRKNKTTNYNQNEQTQKIKEEQHELLNTWCELWCSRRIGSFCPTYSTHSVTQGNDQSPVNVNEMKLRQGKQVPSYL